MTPEAARAIWQRIYGPRIPWPAGREADMNAALRLTRAKVESDRSLASDPVSLLRVFNGYLEKVFADVFVSHREREERELRARNEEMLHL